MDQEEFKRAVRNYYHNNKRILPWREEITPYGVFISEVMLQQTQVPRVLKKYPEFLAKFPTFQSLAAASNTDVLALWSGMGYNRRALFLKRAAEAIVKQYNGNLPKTIPQLIALPGIGPATAASIITYAYNIPTTFIETNVRTVFLHHFFPNQEDISDKDIIPLIEQTLDRKNPREWYYALMDYGSYLKKEHKNPSRNSKHYAKQSKFVGSKRQVRGFILKMLLAKSPRTIEEIESAGSQLQQLPDLLSEVLNDLDREGFIQRQKERISLKNK